MGNCDDAGHVDGFFGGEVGDVRADLTGSESVLEVCRVDQIRTGKVDDLHALLHHGDGFGVDHVLGILGCGNVEGDIIAGLEDFFVFFSLLNVLGQMPCRVDGDERVAADDLHADGLGSVGNQTADGTQTDDAEGLALQFASAVSALAGFHGLCHVFGEGSCPLYAADDVAGSEEESRDGEFLDAVCVSTGGIEYDDALCRAVVHGDIVDTRAASCDGSQLGVKLHIVHGGGTNHNGVGCGHVCGNFVNGTVKTVGADGSDFIEKLDLFHGDVYSVWG